MSTNSTIPRPEYPRPNWTRNTWCNLNGTWDFVIDGKCEMSIDTVSFDKRITVPFAPESELSGIGERGFMECVWYRRKITVPSEWQGQRLLLHFQAIDNDAEIYIDGKLIKRHRGCFTPITVDLGTEWKQEFTLVVRAQTLRDRNRARGKQSDKLENYLCCYTRTTGIWQTVWMEPVSPVFMKRPRVLPTSDGFLLTVPLSANRKGWQIRAVLSKDGCIFNEATAPAGQAFSSTFLLAIPEERRRLWSPEDPYLYDISLTLVDADGNTVDTAQTYGGWRFITIDGIRFLINGKPIFQKLVLDQGYYPDGIWTAPTDEALVHDILMSQSVGFNGARLHQKVFEERFLYHADRLGYLVWGEIGDWGHDWNTKDQLPGNVYQPGLALISQFMEEIERDFSHPAIIGWCGLNETHGRNVDDKFTIDVVNDLTHAMFIAIKAADQSRPVLDVSGYVHLVPESDVYDTHDYGVPKELSEHLAEMKEEMKLDPNPTHDYNEPWHGQPFFISEIGGIGWPPPPPGTWSYGDPPQTEEAFLERLRDTMQTIRADKRVFGYCYTQLTDIYQEVNGIFYFDRTPKFDTQKIAACQSGKAAYEK